MDNQTCYQNVFKLFNEKFDKQLASNKVGEILILMIDACPDSTALPSEIVKSGVSTKIKTAKTTFLPFVTHKRTDVFRVYPLDKRFNGNVEDITGHGFVELHNGFKFVHESTTNH